MWELWTNGKFPRVHGPNTPERGMWRFRSTGGYIFRWVGIYLNAEVRGLPTDNRQRARPGLFIRPIQISVGLSECNCIVRSTTCSLIRLIKPTCFLSSIHSLTTFGVDHTVDIFNTDMAPFDTYSFEVYVFVIEPNTNTSVPIVTFAASEAPDNFIISSKEAKVTTNYTYDSGTGPTTIGVDTREASIAVSRTKFSKGLTIGFLLVNWTLSTGSIYIFLVVIFKGEINETVFLFPVTVILTIPALRNLYVGSPPFGIYIGKSWALRS